MQRKDTSDVVNLVLENDVPIYEEKKEGQSEYEWELELKDKVPFSLDLLLPSSSHHHHPHCLSLSRTLPRRVWAAARSTSSCRR